jgi:hypothetical protein
MGCGSGLGPYNCVVSNTFHARGEVCFKVEQRQGKGAPHLESCIGQPFHQLTLEGTNLIQNIDNLHPHKQHGTIGTGETAFLADSRLQRTKCMTTRACIIEKKIPNK